MDQRARLVFFLDVDNTLLDNDQFKTDVDARLKTSLGEARTQEFWRQYEIVRAEHDFVDYPDTAARLAAAVNDPSLQQQVMDVLHSVSIGSYVYPGVFETISHLWTLGTVAILSDGDQVFQRWKIETSGLSAAVRQNVLIYVHKEEHLNEVFTRFPASHYVMVDDKPRILSVLESQCPSTFTTILVLQGKYARMADYPTKPDLVVPHIADLAQFKPADFLEGAGRRRV